MKVVINRCFGGFSLSDTAYEKLIEYGIPVQQYIEQKRDPKTNLYLTEPKNDGEVIFDRTLESNSADNIKFMRRYWETWTRESRSHPLIIKVVEELGKEANGEYADLHITEIPDDVDWEISEYDGSEHIAEQHKTWY